MNPSSYLSDVEREKLTAFSNDDVLVVAVRKVLLAGIYYNGTLKPGEKPDPDMNFALKFDNEGWSNEELGQFMRASTTGIALVEGAFNEIKNIAKTPVASAAETPKKPNRAK